MDLLSFLIFRLPEMCSTLSMVNPYLGPTGASNSIGRPMEEVWLGLVVNLHLNSQEMQEWVVASMAGIQVAGLLPRCQITNMVKIKAPIVTKISKVKVIRSMSVIWILA